MEAPAAVRSIRLYYDQRGRDRCTSIASPTERDAGLRLYRRRGVNHFMNNDVGVASMTDQILGKARISGQHNRTPAVAHAETVRRSKFPTVIHSEGRYAHTTFIEHGGVGVELADIESHTASRETLLCRTHTDVFRVRGLEPLRHRPCAPRAD